MTKKLKSNYELSMLQKLRKATMKATMKLNWEDKPEIKETFREYLMEKCINETHALDDMLPDVYEDWISGQDVEDIINWAEKWAKPTTPSRSKQEEVYGKTLQSPTVFVDSKPNKQSSDVRKNDIKPDKDIPVDSKAEVKKRFEEQFRVINILPVWESNRTHEISEQLREQIFNFFEPLLKDEPSTPQVDKIRADAVKGFVDRYLVNPEKYHKAVEEYLKEQNI